MNPADQIYHTREFTFKVKTGWSVKEIFNEIKECKGFKTVPHQFRTDGKKENLDINQFVRTINNRDFIGYLN